MKTRINGNGPKYWLWVTKPEYWLDEDGKDNSYLDPKKKDYKDDDWTCSKEIQKGDLVFLWRSKSELRKYLRSIGIERPIVQKSDIGYLIRAESEADGPYEEELWPYLCDYKPLYKFENPVTIEDFKTNSTLRNSRAYKMSFMGSSFPLSKKEWDIINQIAFRKNPGYKTFWENLVGTKVDSGLGPKKEQFPGDQDATEKTPEWVFRKYGPGGEGSEHKKLKDWVAENPESIGLSHVKGSPIKEYKFKCGDAADILFELENNKHVVVEIETNFSEPGIYQALKYKVLECAELGLDIKSSNVKAILIAWSIPEAIKGLCNQYNVEFREIKKDEYN